MQDKEVLLSISSDFDLDHYLGYNNSSLYLEFREYFRIGARRGFFEPLEFLNLFDKQFSIVEELMNAQPAKPSKAIEHLKNLPLNEEQKHVLMGMILKIYGGYPVVKPREENKYYIFKF